MSSLDKAVKNLKYDKRLTEWYLATGQITKEELKKYLDGLPDMAGKIELVNLGDDRSKSDAH